MLSGPAVGSILCKDARVCLEVISSTVCIGKNRFKPFLHLKSISHD